MNKIKTRKILKQIRKGKEFIIDLDNKQYELWRDEVKIGTVDCRITSQTGKVYGKDGSVDVNVLNEELYVLANYNADIRENDRLVYGVKMWTVAKPSYPTPAGSIDGASCLQAPVTYNGIIEEA